MTVLAIVAGDRKRDEVRRIGVALGVEVEFIESDSLGLSRAIAGDLLFVGDGIPGDRALSLIRRLHRRNHSLLIAALLGDTDPGIVDLLEAGAALVIRDGQSPDESAEAIRAAEAGRAILDPDTAGALVVRIQELSKLCVDERIDVSRCDALTAREREIIGLMARRATNEQIAERLGIAVGTVKTHVHNILDKLDVDSRALAGVYWRLFSGESRSARI
jgi:two-component system nitrate/nitrite response regulator NarL